MDAPYHIKTRSPAKSVLLLMAAKLPVREIDLLCFLHRTSIPGPSCTNPAKFVLNVLLLMATPTANHVPSRNR